MKFKKMILFFFVLGGIVNAEAADFYSQKVKGIDGKEKLLSEYKGKAFLFVNIATQCGYTPQLEGLEKLHKSYAAKGLVIIGVPSNDFGGQTPEGEVDVKKFCQLRYGVSFPLTSKMKVKGPDKNVLFKTLLEKSESKNEVAWNFEKFLVDKSGNVIARFDSKVTPEDKTIVDLIQKTLK